MKLGFSRSGIVPASGISSELSAHQMAPAGVVAHSGSWTPAADEPDERNLTCGNLLDKWHHPDTSP